ncbi:MAG: restriction endonuclease subunit S [Myxococcales bacterium]|nr:restriction endonuclease subunit S [Myxococcales bacterium]
MAEAGGLLQTGPFGSQLHAHEYVEAGVPVVMPQDIPSGVIDVRSVARIAEPTAQRLGRHRLQAGDVVFSRRGDLSRCALVEPSQSGWLCGTGCLLLRPAGSRLSGAWVSRIYRHHAIQTRIARLAVGTTMANLNTGILARLEIPSPPLPEQRQIAAILDTLDDAIRKTEQIIAKLKQVKQGLLHDLLTRGIDDNGELRDPERHSEQFKASALGRIPKAWEVSSLGRLLLRIEAGSSPNCPDRPAHGDEWGVLKVSAVRPTGFEPSENKAIVTPSLIDPSCEVRDGDLLITRANTYELVGLTCLVDRPPPRLMLCDKTLRLVLDSRKADARFVFFTSQTPPLRAQIETHATGSSGSMKNIGQSAIRALTFQLPPLTEQVEVASRLCAADARAEAERRSLGQLAMLKAGLMEDLLTGRIRVTSLLEHASP